MVRQSVILIFSVLVGLFTCKGKQDNLSSIPINEIVKDIAKSNVLMGAAVGIADERPKQWDRYEELHSRATDAQLLTLVNDTNAVVRCYAFQALTERNSNDLLPVVLQHISDTATVHTLYGCLGGSQKVGDFFLETVTSSGGNDKFYRLTDKQKATVDSFLLFSNGNKLEAKDRLLAEHEPLEKYYQRIRQIAIEENNKMAVVALSKYKRPQDKPLISALLPDAGSQLYGFAAVVNYPDPSFFPFLQQTLITEITKNNGGNDKRLQLLYQAIVQYKDQPSRQGPS